MSDTLGILLPVCALALVCGGLLALAIYLGFRFVSGNLPGIFDGGSSEDDIKTTPFGRPRPNLRASAEALDFDAAVARHAGENSALSPEAPEYNAEKFDFDTSSPISGRIMRDGRHRRVTGGTPGREQDQDFRRVEGGEPSPKASDLPPIDSPIRRRKRRGRSDDEIFGGMLDDDGDGDVDF
jgi:hypothetical protein